MPNEKAVVLCSGGLNSAVTTSLAVQNYSVFLLHVHYGHRADAREADLFEKQADFFDVRDRLVLEMPHLAKIGGNARVSRKRQIEYALAISERESNCYVPGLIGSLLNAAFGWAWGIGASVIHLGVSENLGPPGPPTSQVHPDYSREFIQLCGYGLGIAAPGRKITIETPLLELSRTEIVKLGHRLGTPFELTWSCLSSGTQPCGGCLGCATRNRGFLEATVPDPILLQPAAH